MMKKLTRYLLIISAGFFCLLFFWLRFIRERLPREIPFNLTILNFFILIFICIILVYSIIGLCKKSMKISLFNNFSKILFRPLVILDVSIKNNVYIKKHFDIYFIPWFLAIKAYAKMFADIEIIIQFIISLTLGIEVFYAKEIKYLYKIVTLVLVLYIIRYCLYTIKMVKEDQINRLKEICYLRETHIAGPIITVENFMSNQTTCALNNQPLNTYGIDVHLDYISKEYEKLSLEGKGHLRIDTAASLNNIRKIVNFILMLDLMENTYLLKKTNHKLVKIFILILTLCSWIYILVKSFHTLPENSFIWLNYLIPYYENPFL